MMSSLDLKRLLDAITTIDSMFLTLERAMVDAGLLGRGRRRLLGKQRANLQKLCSELRARIKILEAEEEALARLAKKLEEEVGEG